MMHIAGIVHLDGRSVDPGELDRMAGVLFDQTSQFRQKKRVGTAAFVCAGHNAVPEDRFQRQPVLLSDGRMFLFAGRLDNRKELIAALNLGQHGASAMADGTVAGKAWEKWGADGLARWVGPHASACWDPADRKLTLARGAPRGPALMFHRRRDSVYFSTRLDALFCLPFIPREMDEGVLADILLGALSGRQFLYKGIESVANSHWSTIGSGGFIRHNEYWSLDPEKQLKFSSEEQCWEAFSELFRDVVERYLRSAGPIGIRLSGGLDSSAVAAQAATILAERGEELHTYTRIPQPDAVLPKKQSLRYSDESSKVKLLASQYPNMRVNLVPPESGGVMDGLEQWYGANYLPAMASPSFVSGYRPMLEKARSDGVRLLLNGGNGNITFSHSGFGRFRELFASGRWLKLRRELNAFSARGYKTRALFRREVILPMIPMPVYKWRQRLRRSKKEKWEWFSIVNPEFAKETGAIDRLVEQENLRVYFYKWSTWQRRAQFIGAPGQVGQGGGGDLLYGFDQRDPTGDRRIIEFCLALPEKYYLSDGIDRRLARLGLKHLLPEAIRMDFRLGLQDIDWAHRVKEDADSIHAAYEQFRNDPDLSRYLDFERLDSLWSEFQASDISNLSYQRAVRYQLAMLGPLHAGNFIRWFHGRND